jgi:hypothetical protein
MPPEAGSDNAFPLRAGLERKSSAIRLMCEIDQINVWPNGYDIVCMDMHVENTLLSIQDR